MDIGRNFVGRLSFISRIEEAWWNDAVKIVGIHGLGGIGKTFLCGRMEQRALTHHLLAKRLNKSIWLDFREGAGSTLAGFLRQMDGIARDFGFQTFNRVLDDQEAYPTPLEKCRPWFDHVNSICRGNALLILDNLESALDGEGRFRDPELGAWFIELLARSPGWRVLVTCRRQFDFFPGGRQLASARWLHLAEMGITERLTLLNRDATLRDRTEADKREILKVAGGHPYIINLVANYLRTHPELPEALCRAEAETAAYAQLDWFLSLLTPDERDWLLIAALFPPPKLDSLIIMTKISRDQAGDSGTVEASFHAAVRRLAELSLAGSSDGELQVHPLISWQLLENRQSSHMQTEARVKAILRAMAVVFLSVAQDRARPEKAMLLLQGVEPALAQLDWNLLAAYLQECAAVFLGFVSAAVFADIVRRAEAALLEKADEAAFFTLGFCAQELCQMRHFTAAEEIFTTLLQNERLPEGLRGKILGSLGTLFMVQRDWPQALSSYQKALEWKEKTGQHHELGGTWHQIGIVYEEQRDWPQALSSYQKALEWEEKTGQHHELGGTWHQIGRVYQEQGDFAEALRNYLRALALFSEMKWAKEAGIAFGSIHRIFPHLSSKEKEGLKDALPEEMYGLLEKEETPIP